MSRERRLEIPATSVFSFLQSDKLTSSNFEQETRHGLEAFKAAFHYAKGPEDQAAFPKAAENYSSAFDADMPGLVTLDELSAKEDLLGQWTLKLGKIKATLKVKMVPKQVVSVANTYHDSFRTLGPGTNPS